MTDDNTVDNVHRLRPRDDGDDATAPDRRFSISESLIAGQGIDQPSPAPDAQGPAMVAGESDGMHDRRSSAAALPGIEPGGEEVQWADGTPTGPPARRRGLRKQKARTKRAGVASNLDTAAVAGGRDFGGHSWSGIEPGAGPVSDAVGTGPPFAAGSRSSRPARDDWPSVATGRVGDGVTGAVPRQTGVRDEPRRRRAWVGLLVAGLIAGAAIVVASISNGGTPRLNAPSNTHPQTHAASSIRAGGMGLGAVRGTTSVKRVAHPRRRPGRGAGGRSRSHPTSSTPTVASTPTVTSTPAVASTPAVVSAPTVTSTSAGSSTPAGTSTPTPSVGSSTGAKASAPSATTGSSSGSSAGGLPDLQQTEQQP